MSQVFTVAGDKKEATYMTILDRFSHRASQAGAAGLGGVYTDSPQTV